ncbi:MAG: hypothetical protein Q7T11_05275 [Deltaproteobacteria bacterium]|nr:hypothetical protein [Deltaproteobacteria bacterium]
MEKSKLWPQVGRFKTGSGKTRVNVIYLKTPASVTAYYYGGKNHLGALTAGVHVNSHAYHRTYCRPGHHDDLVTKKAEKILCKNLKGLVVTGAGIHYEKATPSEIKAIVKNAEHLSRRVASL